MVTQSRNARGSEMCACVKTRQNRMDNNAIVET